jgi:hypothetical protein
MEVEGGDMCNSSVSGTADTAKKAVACPECDRKDSPQPDGTCRCGMINTGLDKSGNGGSAADERAGRCYEEFASWAHGDASSTAHEALDSTETTGILIGVLDNFCNESKTLSKFAKTDPQVLVEMLKVFLLYGYFMGSSIEGAAGRGGEMRSGGGLVEWWRMPRRGISCCQR